MSTLPVKFSGVCVNQPDATGRQLLKFRGREEPKSWLNAELDRVVSENESDGASTQTPRSDPSRNQAVIYARVSSKEQEKEGFSIPAQLKVLRECAAWGFRVADIT
jgi:hypothetical protein